MVHNPQPQEIDKAASETGVTQYISSKERKNAMIRYVGFSVIVSVGVGASVIEGLRKWRSFWESPQDKAEKFGLEKLLQGDFEFAPPELEPAIGDASVQLSNIERSRTTEAFADVETNNLQETAVQVSLREIFQFQELENSVTASVLEPVFEQPFLYEIENDADHSEVSQTSPLAVQEPLTLPILDLYQDTQICRVKVLDSEQVRFACLFEGKYYCFVRAEKTKNQAFKTAALLADEGNQPMITAIKQGYAVWTREPTAILNPTA
jgi:hypothetical protein